MRRRGFGPALSNSWRCTNPHIWITAVDLRYLQPHEAMNG
jgi:hypothetical protein